jgi:hypothetical protein
MIGGDPNLVNPQNRQGYGRNVQTQLIPQPKTTPASKPTTPTVVDSMGEQSIQAVLQLGVLVRFCVTRHFAVLQSRKTAHKHVHVFTHTLIEMVPCLFMVDVLSDLNHEVCR